MGFHGKYGKYEVRLRSDNGFVEDIIDGSPLVSDDMSLVFYSDDLPTTEIIRYNPFFWVGYNCIGNVSEKSGRVVHKGGLKGS